MKQERQNVQRTEIEMVATLVQAAQSGQKEAFEKLVYEYHGRLFRFIHRQISDMATVEDIVQDAFLIAYRSLGQCRRPELFGTWLFSIAQNLIRQWIQKKPKMGTVSRVSEIQTENPSNDQDRLALLEQSFGALSEEMHTVIRMKYQQQMTCEEIAARLQKPIGTIRSWLVRAHRRLKKEIESRLEEDEQ
jgi:RNA polymerase sigma-70 factor (ECF subfamily)